MLYDNRVNENSGVSFTAGTMQFSSANDKNPICRNMTYCGVIKKRYESLITVLLEFSLLNVIRLKAIMG